MHTPLRGDVWDANFGQTVGHEQRGWRPSLILSIDSFNRGPAGLVLLAPFTTQDKGIAMHVHVLPPEGGLKEGSFLKPEDLRSISIQRLGQRRGSVSAETLAQVERRLRILLGL